MRHSEIRTALSIYGDVVTDEMTQANSKIAITRTVIVPVIPKPS